MTVFFLPFVQAQKIYEWRNTNRSGIYEETNLLKNWSEEGPELIRIYLDIGNGYGSPVFTDNRMYIIGEIDSIGYLFAYDLMGELLWKNDYGKEWTKSFSGSRSTPTIVDNLIYVCSGLGNITCFDSKKGKKIWSVDMLKDLHGSFTMHGHSESLLIDDDKVFLT
ncbi:MAG: alcohol dehydrogenase, partial [Bacteroidetes bacterium]